MVDHRNVIVGIKIFEEEKIIFLEHDCLCDNTFFRFMDELLELYKFEPRIKLISGNYICKNILKFKLSLIGLYFNMGNEKEAKSLLDSSRDEFKNNINFYN